MGLIQVQLDIKDLGVARTAPETEHYMFNPHLFAYAMLVNEETMEEIPYMDDTMHILSGCIASCVYHLKDPENDNKFGAFFVFPDISIRQEGTFRLKITLFKINAGQTDPLHNSSRVDQLKHIFTEPFFVYAAKAFPPLLPSSILSRSFADQGLKLRLRKTPK